MEEEMELVSNEEFQKRLRKKYKSTRVAGKEYRKSSSALPKRLKHNSFDGGEYARTYMSSKYNSI